MKKNLIRPLKFENIQTKQILTKINNKNDTLYDIKTNEKINNKNDKLCEIISNNKINNKNIKNFSI